MKIKILVVALLIVNFSNAQLLQWNTFGNTGLETIEPSVFNNANISTSNLTLGAGIGSIGNANRIGGNNWFDTGNTAAGNTIAEAIAGNDYIQFIVTPNSLSDFTPTSLVFGWDSSGTGPSTIVLRSSVDGFTTNLGSVAVAASLSGPTAYTISISGLLNITTATTFRVYGIGATGTGGTGGFDVGSNVINVQLNGTTTTTAPTCTPPSITSISPAAGIIGSQVTITASAGSLLGASAIFNGVNATTVSSSATQLVVTVPIGATTGNLVISDTQPCSVTSTFTVLPTVPICGYVTDLFISEVTDSNYGGLSYIEIYNATGATVNLADYSLQFYQDGATSPYSTTGVSLIPAFSGTLANGQTYVVSTSESGFTCGVMGGDGSLANLQTNANGINFGTNADDQIALFKGSTMIDIWGAYSDSNWSSSLGIGTSGADFRRKTTATMPTTTFNTSDWTVIDWTGSGSSACVTTNDYSDIGNYSYSAATSTTWNGTTWSNGTPTLSKLAIIDGNYNTTPNGSFEACSVLVNAGKVLTIFANQYVAIQYNLTVTPTGNVIVKNNGSLVQIDDSGINTGSINVERTASVKLLDYVYWSSPVLGFPVTSVSPGSPSSLIFKWVTTLINANGGEGNWQNTAETMAECKGYIVRAPNGFSNTSAANYTATFTGNPFNGVCQPSIFRGDDTNAGTVGPNGVMRTIKDDNWNLLGNPYPCSINAIKFLTLNTSIDGNIRLWTHGTLPSSAILDPFYGNYVYNYNPGDYITYNATGTSSGPSAFNGYIASGQGFFVIMNDGPADSTQKVTFNNSLRETVGTPNTYYDNSYFYKNSSALNRRNPPENGRIWLDLIDQANDSSRLLLGYVEGATIAKDRLYDVYFKAGNGMSIYSLINNESASIQGRPLPFNSSDIVPLGVKIRTTGTYSIAIGALDGFFQNANKNIYLEDLLTGGIYDLRLAPYTFTSDSGTFDSRFRLRYRRHSHDDEKINDDKSNEIFVYNLNNELILESNSQLISSLKLFDILGRELCQKESVNSNQFSIVSSNFPRIIIAKIKLVNGEVVTKKLAK
ncbi:lamin tail domain-containing protein [Flavobacterium paronense]|uniref:Lamin tail domain-containing protein n=1 Tax=Flavobacterium paronense TaxID=1392775 RepID=A0ABV5GE93_9FLAO|nr:lamin tail domain-containing protein [Flavobacterium paronense]MDN3678261.1 lamin tail domain-containing protein [Flavobacterium paronense]